MIKIESERQITLMIILLAFCCVLMFYFHKVIGIGIVFTHFFYIPIILASLWWKKKGVAVAVFLAMLLIISHNYFREFAAIANDYLRALMFVVISFTIALLSEKISIKEKALRASCERYRVLFETAKDAIFVSDETGRFVDVNQAVCQSLGYSREELLKLSPKEIDADPTGYNAFCKVRDGLTDKLIFETNQKKKDGTLLPVEITGSFFNDNGQQRALAIARDITERKLSEELLRESEAKHRLLAENTVDCIWQMNLDLKFTYINQAILPFLGYTTKEWIGSKLSEYCSSENIEKIQAIISDALANLPDKTATVFEASFYHKNGEEIPCEVNGKIVLNDAGNPIYFQGTTRNITERKKAEKVLKESNDRQRYLYSMTRLMCDNLPDLIWTKDSENRFIFANKACCEKLLNTKDTDEPVGKTDMYFAKRERESHPENPEYHKFGEMCMDSDSAILETKKPLKFDESGNLKGKFVYFDVYKAPFWDENGKLMGTVGCARDITREKEIEKKIEKEQKKAEKEKLKLEAQLRQSQKMEAIGTLAGGVAHDFNNLLTVILGNAQLALMNVIKDNSLRKGIEEIKKAGEKAASLTHQLLAFSRKQIVQPKILDINELLTDMEKMLGRLIGEDIELLTIPASVLWQVEIDPGQIEQVLLNLAINARDAMPGGGKLTLETSNVELEDIYFRNRGVESTPGPYVMLAVSDTGSGMDKETKEHIFEPFFTTKEVGKGTGLGLSTVYGIVKQNNGFIWVYSEPEQGTVFKVYLPKVKKDVDTEEKEKKPVAKLDGSETVLIVEDNNSLRNLAQSALRRYGYKVLDAENGEDALRVCKEYDGQIDLMITDVVMPKMGGREAAKRLRPLYPQMKVIYMSGYTDNAIVHHGVLEPGLNFLEKPFTPETLARKVRKTLDK
ncbi:MAG: hypothetical protein BA867_05375 [Desulfobacterales bacterium S5133MH16]|nr:MAG: hypothetical protein BA867_05375 [Desulfobacterales bacterium S5133MH16]